MDLSEGKSFLTGSFPSALYSRPENRKVSTGVIHIVNLYYYPNNGFIMICAGIRKLAETLTFTIYI